MSPFVVNWQETKTLWDFSWAACNIKRKIFTCPGHTSSQRCRPLARSRSSSQSFCQTVSRRRTARCNRGSSGCPRHGRPPLGEIFVLKGCWPWMGVGGFCHQYYSLGFDFQCEFQGHIPLRNYLFGNPTFCAAYFGDLTKYFNQLMFRDANIFMSSRFV